MAHTMPEDLWRDFPKTATEFETRFSTEADAVRPKHLQAYLDELAFRHNRRKTNGIDRIAARVIEQLVVREPSPMRRIIDEPTRCRWFTSAQHPVPT
ncbi:MAG: hypothetical protein F9K29_06115 [Hyphomicrobiaceae bacterium]|nr:MAG: hypothetical protein F9K29_06115 [Hyphomicrobiaceae bacterium]